MAARAFDKGEGPECSELTGCWRVENIIHDQQQKSSFKVGNSLRELSNLAERDSHPACVASNAALVTCVTLAERHIP